MRYHTHKERIFDIIFGTDTPAGKAFDLFLLAMILLSVLVVMLDSIDAFHSQYGQLFWYAEWGFTLLFSTEYLVRLWASPKPGHYARSFYGIIDLLAILPTYLQLLLPGTQYLLVLRLLRVMRVFRIVKAIRYLAEANLLWRSIKGSLRKITVFFTFILLLACIMGSVMYILEGPVHGFTSIPKGIYWAIVTITTVGYGDISPQTPLGQLVASVTMILGYSVLAVPTGIFTATIHREMSLRRDLRRCENCDRSGHDHDARFCNHCGTELEEQV
ncbi:ion transporter [Ferrimonas sediminicola]|uniref:Ion transporter n=1 Tax=Ferrimonas sediminicola TaxID=2569538 RepID=A0A4U1BC80_9GAMM|nr:ion transporter [Ferrimonas sediminicola]TKB48633.1 ion transporter [Ferrimonas sediminicola]